MNFQGSKLQKVDANRNQNTWQSQSRSSVQEVRSTVSHATRQFESRDLQRDSFDKPFSPSMIQATGRVGPSDFARRASNKEHLKSLLSKNQHPVSNIR